MDKGLLTRFINKIAIDKNDCWIWQGGQYGSHKNKYGKFWNGKKDVLAHRFCYQHFVGDLEKGLTIDHQCNVTLCVNPNHLKQMTMQENVLRGDNPIARNARKTICVNGHKFTPENTKKHKNGRCCRACVNKYMIKYNKRRSKNGK